MELSIQDIATESAYRCQCFAVVLTSAAGLRGPMYGIPITQATLLAWMFSAFMAPSAIMT